MLRAAQAAAGPFSGSITATRAHDRHPSFSPTDPGYGTAGCLVSVTLPYHGVGLPFGLSQGSITAPVTDCVN